MESEPMRLPLLALLTALLISGCATPVSTTSPSAAIAPSAATAPEAVPGASLLGAWFYVEDRRCLERYEFTRQGVFYSASGQERLKGSYVAEDLPGEPPVIRVTRTVEESNRKDDCSGPTTDTKGQKNVRYVLVAADRASIQVCVSADGKGCFGPLTRKLPPTPWLSYGARVDAVVKPYIVYPKELLAAPSLRSNPSTEVEVQSRPDGKIAGFRMIASSGTKSWDDTVMWAMKQVDTLPADSQGKVPPVMTIGFRPHP